MTPLGLISQTAWRANPHGRIGRLGKPFNQARLAQAIDDAVQPGLAGAR